MGFSHKIVRQRDDDRLRLRAGEHLLVIVEERRFRQVRMFLSHTVDPFGGFVADADDAHRWVCAQRPQVPSADT